MVDVVFCGEILGSRIGPYSRNYLKDQLSSKVHQGIIEYETQKIHM